MVSKDSNVDGSASNESVPTAPDIHGDAPLDKSDSDKLLEENRKRNTSGLSWDEVAAEDKKGWREITDMGEGD